MDKTPSSALPSTSPLGDPPVPIPKKRLSLQGYLGASLGIVIFVLSLLLAGILDSFARREVLKLAEQNLDTASRQMARELAAGMHGFGRDVEALAKTDLFQDPNSSQTALRNVLNRFAEQHPEFTFIGIVDISTDNVVAANSGLFEGRSAKGRPAYEEAKTKPFLGDVHPAVRLAELLPKPVNGEALRFFDASAPITDKSGQPFRVLAGHISTNWADQVRERVLSPLARDKKIELIMIDTAGKVVVSPNAAIRSGTPIETLVPNATAERAGVQRWADDRDYLTISAPVKPHGAFDGFGWGVIARQPTEVAFASATVLRNSVFAGALILAGIAAWLAWFLAGRIARPMRDLAKSAEHMSSNLNGSYQLESSIGEVASVHQALAHLATKGEQFARSSEQQYQQFVTLSDCLPHLVFLANANGEIEYMSAQWTADLGLVAPVSLNDLATLLHPEDVLTFHGAWQSSKASGHELSATVRMAKLGSTDFQWYKLRGKAVGNLQGYVMRWVGTLTNIHQSMLDAQRIAQALENERKARSASERVSQMKDDFLATLSHELRTPLSVIGGWAQILEVNAKGDDHVARAGAIIKRNVDVQARLINDLLDMSAVIAGKIILDPKPADTTQLIESVVQSLSKSAADKGIEIRTALTNAAVIVVDPVRLIQILTNLITNAIKFTDAGGVVTVSVTKDGDSLKLEVSDTGCGIAPEFLPHIFDRFRQEDSSFTRKRGGLGLGLAIVKSLVELHEGTITAQSEGQGKGCTFTITLPVMPSRFGAADASAPVDNLLASQQHMNGAVILLIDDDDDARDMAKELLVRFGARVVAVASAKQGLALLDQEAFDVVLCDISMPEVDGYECVRAIRSHANPTIASIPAVALTAFAMKQDQSAAREAGFDLHVAKPFAANDLLTAISKAITTKGNTSKVVNQVLATQYP